MTDFSEDIFISGAGLVGSLLALTLIKRGLPVVVYEKRPDMREESLGGGRSINLIISAKGLKALENVGIKDEVLKLTVPVTGRMMHSTEGELNYQPYGRDQSECNYSVSRSELNKKLIDLAEREGVRFYFEAPLEELDLDQKRLKFQGHPQKNFKLLFGADGAGSQTRKELMRFLKNRGQDHVEPLGADYKELFMPAKNDGTAAMEKNALHIWPRGSHMLMALPNLDASFTMTLYLPTQDFEQLKTPQDLMGHFEKHYPDAIDLMPDFVEDFFQNPQGFLGTVHAKPWVYRDCLALIGDAAHAIVPFFGQGMNSGLEDITYLCKMIDQHKSGPEIDWENVFKSYEEHQGLSGQAIAEMAIENFTEMKDKVGDARFLLRKKIEHQLEVDFPTLYRSRYAMVTYTQIPYHLCQKAGEIQNEILDELCHNISSPEELDVEHAKTLIEQKLTPFRHEHGISFS